METQERNLAEAPLEPSTPSKAWYLLPWLFPVLWFLPQLGLAIVLYPLLAGIVGWLAVEKLRSMRVPMLVNSILAFFTGLILPFVLLVAVFSSWDAALHGSNASTESGSPAAQGVPFDTTPDTSFTQETTPASSQLCTEHPPKSVTDAYTVIAAIVCSRGETLVSISPDGGVAVADNVEYTVQVVGNAYQASLHLNGDNWYWSIDATLPPADASSSTNPNCTYNPPTTMTDARQIFTSIICANGFELGSLSPEGPAVDGGVYQYTVGPTHHTATLVSNNGEWELTNHSSY